VAESFIPHIYDTLNFTAIPRLNIANFALLSVFTFFVVTWRQPAPSSDQSMNYSGDAYSSIIGWASIPLEMAMFCYAKSWCYGIDKYLQTTPQISISLCFLFTKWQILRTDDDVMLQSYFHTPRLLCLSPWQRKQCAFA